MTTTITKLKVVNRMLAAVGDSPVNSLQGEDVYPEAEECAELVDDITASLQLTSWNFNTTVATLPLDTLSQIPLPNTAAYVYSADCNVSMKKGKLYNKDTNTFEFEEAPELTLISLYSFEDMPRHAQEWVKIKSIVDYADSRGSIPSYKPTDLEKAWVLLRRMERRNNPLNWNSNNVISNVNSGVRRTGTHSFRTLYGLN